MVGTPVAARPAREGPYPECPALRRYRRALRRALIAFTAVTVVAYFALARGQPDAFGRADKAVEALRIAVLVADGRRAR